MRAVVVASEGVGSGALPPDLPPAPLLWLVDRPFVQRVCEELVGRGVAAIDWVIRGGRGDLKRFLGGGERWGCRFRHLPATTEAAAYAAVRAAVAGSAGEGPVVVGHADRLANLPDVLMGGPGARPGAVLYGTRRGDTAGWRWSGWAVLAGRACREFPAAEREDELGAALAEHLPGGPEWAEADALLDVRTLLAYLESNRSALAGRGGNGVHLARSAAVHPSAMLVPPVCVGPRAELAAGVTVGPYVTVGPGSFVERYAVLRDAVVLPRTYVGEGLRLSRVVVARDRAYRPEADGRVTVDDDLPIGCLARPGLAWPAARLAQRLAGVLGRVGRHGGRGAGNGVRSRPE